jgi:hypothetical protein
MKLASTTKWLPMVIMTFLLATFFSAAWASETTIIGEVNDNYQIVANGQIYEIADTAEGNELAENNVSAKAKVIGIIETRDDMVIITVSSYEIMHE